MKKVIILLMLACIAAGANAQAYIGGTLGLGIQNTKEDYGLDFGGVGRSYSETTTTFTIAPEIGYNFNKVLAIGTSIGLEYIENGYSTTGFYVMPYLRATFARAGKVDFFAEAAVGYERYSSQDSGFNDLLLALRPGFLVHVSDKVSLIARTILVGYESTDGLKQTTISIGNNFAVGVLFNL